MISQIRQNASLPHRLRRLPANPANPHQRRGSRSIRPPNLLRRQFQHRLKKPNLLISNRKLRRMHSHGQTSRARRDVIPRQRPLPPFIELSRSIQRQRMRRNHDAAGQYFPNLLVQHVCSPCNIPRLSPSPGTPGEGRGGGLLQTQTTAPSSNHGQDIVDRKPRAQPAFTVPESVAGFSDACALK